MCENGPAACPLARQRNHFTQEASKKDFDFAAQTALHPSSHENSFYIELPALTQHFRSRLYHQLAAVKKIRLEDVLLPDEKEAQHPRESKQHPATDRHAREHGARAAIELHMET